MSPGGPAGVRVPAEWEPHAATWLAWPRLARDWPGKLDAVRWAFCELVRKLQQSERVRMLVQDPAEELRARSRLRRSGAADDRIEFLACPTDRAWVRDSGPTFTTQAGGLQAVCWRFDGWGRYSNWSMDERVGRFVAEAAGAVVVEPRVEGIRVAMEGGAVETDGSGTILTTEQCLLRKDRGRGGRRRSRDEAEEILRSALGAGSLVWLDRGIAGDDTSGHVDQLARFVGPGTVAAAVERDPRDDNFAPLRENLRRLQRARDRSGRQLDIVELPMPRPLVFDGDRLPASYANFYIANGSVLVPTFNDPSDRVAVRILEECFPGREVCGIHCVDVVLGQGALHCLTQQQPRAG